MKRTTLVLLNDVLIRYKNTSRSTATISYTCLRQYRYSSTIRQPFAENQGALKGVKILDLSRVLAAPFCTQILSDYGADVIKVEDIERGDDTRYFKIDGEEPVWKSNIGPISNYFAAVNRNKRSICLNLKHEKGKNVFFRLLKEADVVVENFRPGAMKKLGLDYEVLAKVNPRIIYASVSGYGSTGPFARRAGYDMIVSAEAGFLNTTGERGRSPVRPGVGLTDISTGFFTHGAIIAALYAREKTGRGQKIETSLFESQIAVLSYVALSWLNVGQETERWGSQHPSVVPYDAFKTKDLYFVCGAINDKQFSTLCKILGLEDLQQDERFCSNSMRVENREELFTILNGAFATKSTDEWLEAFEGSGMPYAPINNMQKVFSHSQTEARDMVQDFPFEATTSGSIKLLGPPVKFSDTHASIRQRPPLLGEHTEEILKEIGMSDQEIDGLKDDKVI